MCTFWQALSPLFKNFYAQMFVDILMRTEICS